MKITFLILCIAALASISIQASTQSNGNEINTSQPGKNQAPPPPLADNPPKGKVGGKPPRDAIEMCLGKNENSACTMNGPQGEEKGFCEHTPDKLYFACNPQRGPSRGPQPAPRNDQASQSSPLGLPDAKVTHFPINRESSQLKSQ